MVRCSSIRSARPTIALWRRRSWHLWTISMPRGEARCVMAEQPPTGRTGRRCRQAFLATPTRPSRRPSLAVSTSTHAMAVSQRPMGHSAHSWPTRLTTWMQTSTESFTVPKSSVKSCEETEPRRPGKDVMRAERITAMTKSRPPGPAGLPLLGSVFPWLRNQPRFLLETYRRYGQVVRFEFLGFHGAILHGAE